MTKKKRNKKKKRATLQHWYKTSSLAMLRVLPPTFKSICCKVFFFAGDETRNIAVQLVLQQRCQKSCTFFCARFTVPIDLSPLPSPFHIIQLHLIFFLK